eukprot:m.72582 g.72582  ORF g.72582 m.72582 type:complete len:55 (-) comp8388_c1_seq1:1785-1949(-)
MSLSEQHEEEGGREVFPLDVVGEMPLFDGEGNPHSVASLVEGKKTILIFVRHFL